MATTMAIETDDGLQQIDSLLWARHLGQPHDAWQLRRLADQYHLDDVDLATRLDRVLARKAAAAEAREPKFVGKGVVALVPPKVKEKYTLGIKRPTDERARHFNVGDFLRDDCRRPLPDLFGTEFYSDNGSGEGEAVRDWCVDVLLRVHRGEIGPRSRVAFVAAESDELLGVPGVLVIRTDGLASMLSLRLADLVFLPAPGQSRAMFDKRLATLRQRVRKLENQISESTWRPQKGALRGR